MFTRKPHSTFFMRAAARRFLILSLAALLLVPTAVWAPPASGAPVEAPSMPRNPSKPTEVVIIGTRHSAQLEYEDHAPARMRALLNRIDPAAIGIETTPEWFAEEIYYEIAYESYGVAAAWAREKGKEVRPIDWQAGTMEFIKALSWPNVEASPPSGEPDEPGGEEYTPLGLWDMRELLFADSPEWRDAVNRDYAMAMPEQNPWNEAVRRYMLYRNLMIAREIVNLAADYDGRRVAVLIGAAHKPDLDLLLANVPNIVVRHASEWWGDGLTPEEVEAEERRTDHLAVLWYNLASGQVKPAGVDLARMDALLARLEVGGEAGVEAGGSWDPEVRFLRAQRHFAAGETDEALKILRELAWGAEWEDRPFTYPDRDLARRVIEWYARDAAKYGLPGDPEPGLGNVISPVANLTIRQRVLYELAVRDFDVEWRERARVELEHAGLNAKQMEELRALLEGE